MKQQQHKKFRQLFAVERNGSGSETVFTLRKALHGEKNYRSENSTVRIFVTENAAQNYLRTLRESNRNFKKEENIVMNTEKKPARLTKNKWDNIAYLVFRLLPFYRQLSLPQTNRLTVTLEVWAKEAFDSINNQDPARRLADPINN